MASGAGDERDETSGGVDSAERRSQIWIQGMRAGERNVGQGSERGVVRRQRRGAKIMMNNKAEKRKRRRGTRTDVRLHTEAKRKKDVGLHSVS